MVRGYCQKCKKRRKVNQGYNMKFYCDRCVTEVSDIFFVQKTHKKRSRLRLEQIAEQEAITRRKKLEEEKNG